MTIEQVEDYVRSELPLIAEKLGLGDWEISLVFELLGGESSDLADCEVKHLYRKAVITFYTGAWLEYDDTSKLRNAIVHELLHIHQSEWFHFGDIVDKAIMSSDDTVKSLISQAWTTASELQVRSLMMMLDHVNL